MGGEAIMLRKYCTSNISICRQHHFISFTYRLTPRILDSLNPLNQKFAFFQKQPSETPETSDTPETQIAMSHNMNVLSHFEK